MRALLFLLAALGSVKAASLSFSWEPVSTNAVYVLYLNNRPEYVGASNGVRLLTLEPLVPYRVEVTAVIDGAESERSDPVDVTLWPATLFLERAGSASGPWTTWSSNSTFVPIEATQGFYRGRITLGPYSP